MKIYKIASLKEKINRFKITDPYMIFFISKYEKEIPWKDVKSLDDVNSYISNTLLPKLYSKIDPESESNYYLDDIDLEAEFQNNQGNPQVAAAYAIYKEDPEGAKAQILEEVNGNKERIFKSWWEYFTEGNDIYADNPAFSYSILKPIIDKSKADSKRSTMPLNEMAVAALYQRIQDHGGKESFRVDKQYATEANQMNMQTSEVVKGTTFKDGNGWIKIPGKQSDPSGFAENVNKLTSYSVPNGWCTGSGMASPYLSRGDFYLYVVEGKAEVAIRMEGGSVAEIQGERNNRPYFYVDQIEEFLKSQNINPEDNRHYQELMESKMLNEDIKDPEKLTDFIDKIDKSPALANQLSKENRANPEIMGRVATAIDQAIRNLDEGLTGYYGYSLNSYIRYYNALDPDLRAHLGDNTREFLKAKSIETLKQPLRDNAERSFFQSINNLPEEIGSDEMVKQLVFEKIKILTQQKPWAICALDDGALANIPEAFVEEAKNHPISQTVLNLKNYDGESDHPEAIASEGWQEPDPDDYKDWYTWREGGQEEYENDLAEWEKKKDEYLGGEDIRDVTEVKGYLTDAWCTYISKNPSVAEDVWDNQSEYTDYYEENDDYPGHDDGIRAHIDTVWSNLIHEDPRELYNAPRDISEQYYEDPYDDDDRYYHYTSIWLDYLIKGNWDALDEYSCKEALEDMSPSQFEELATAISQQKPDIDMTDLPDAFQNFIYNYEESLNRREKERREREQGQQDFQFYNEMQPNEYAVDINGIVRPYADVAQANSMVSWYRMSNALRNLIKG